MRARKEWLLAATFFMAGCSVLGGRKGDIEAPSQVALSLYAGWDVNPNAQALAPDAAAPVQQTPDMAAITLDTATPEGPYLVNLSGSSKFELAEKMRALMDYLHEPEAGQAIPLKPLQVTPLPPKVPSVGAAQSAVEPPAGEASASEGVTGAVVATKTEWQREESTSSAPANLPVPIRGGHVGGGSTSEGANPSPALGQYAEGPSGLVASQAAPRASAVATPITFKVLQLKDDSVFLNADRDALIKDLKKTLGSTYVDDDDYVLLPGQFKYVTFNKIDKKTQYVAILANFHDQERAVWKQVQRVEAGGYKYSLLVLFQNIEVSVVDERRPLPPRSKS